MPNKVRPIDGNNMSPFPYNLDYCDSGDLESWIESQPTLNYAPVRHGTWELTVCNEKINYRLHVDAACSECAYEKYEIWAGFFPGVPDNIAKDVALQNAAKSEKLSFYCPNCGAKMDAKEELYGAQMERD